MADPGQLEQAILKLAGELLEECQKTGSSISRDARAILPQSGATIPLPLAEALLKLLSQECEARRAPMRYGFLGPFASFSHQATLAYAGPTVVLKPLPTIEEVFAEVERGNLERGLVPVENAIQGVETWTLDSFLTHEVVIVGEQRLEVHQNLLGHSELEAVKRVYSHPQAFAQSRKWLATHLPQAELVPVASTAKGAELAASEGDGAAIGNELAAAEYGLEVLARSIEDIPGNATRFLVLAKPGVQVAVQRPSEELKTSLVFATQHKPGALFDSLKPFHDYGVNMTMIESRPTRNMAWTYVFFVDIEGAPDDEKVSKALEAMRSECFFLKQLGTYPASER